MSIRVQWFAEIAVDGGNGEDILLNVPVSTPPAPGQSIEDWLEQETDIARNPQGMGGLVFCRLQDIKTVTMKPYPKRQPLRPVNAQRTDADLLQQMREYVRSEGGASGAGNTDEPLKDPYEGSDAFGSGYEGWFGSSS